MTVSSFCSLSLNPPLVSVAIDLRAYTYEFLKTAGFFAVNFLASDQEDISRRFATSGPKNFADIPITTAITGAPILTGSLAWVDCRVADILRGGDHDIFVGEILAGDQRQGQPLLYYCGKYRQLAELNDA
jgi:flavin reductase (DIM6/NTAB) family NADH-FMN oxidoreductase RutF